MYRIPFLILITCFCLIMNPESGWSADFLGVPLIPDGQTHLRTDSRLEMVSPLSHDEALAFYKEALKPFHDIRFRDWKDETYIEDDSNLPWHSITISKHDKEGTSIVIVKDNWTWIIGTLVLRYIGVFMVLLCLLLGMSISGAIISRSVKKLEGKK